MPKIAPFLPGISTLLCGRAKHKKQDVLGSERDKLLAWGPGIRQQLRDEISPELLKKYGTTQRVRAYPSELTFWAFLAQVFAADGSCTRAVTMVQQWAHKKSSVPSSATSSYCAARQALPIEMLQAVNRSLCDQLDRHLSQDRLWRGLRVMAEDGTSAQMPDSEANRNAYPYPSGQAEGCGFPALGLVGLVDLGHGGLRDFACSTVETGELRGHDALEGYLEKGDLLVADRLYSSYETLSRLAEKEVGFVGLYHHGRKKDFRKGKKIGPNQRIQRWKKPRQQPKMSRLSAERWADLPEEMEVRVIRTTAINKEGRECTSYVITTLLDHEQYPWEEVISLYLHRWEIELSFRDIKTTMGMEMLRTKSPEMAHKEVLMHMIAYNVVRLLMLKAGNKHGVNHRRLSFKGTIQVLEEFRIGFAEAKGKPRLLEFEKSNLLERIAERYNKERPGRSEPRKKKRRPKSYGWLQQPRHSYFEHYHNENPPLKTLDQPS